MCDWGFLLQYPWGYSLTLEKRWEPAIGEFLRRSGIKHIRIGQKGSSCDQNLEFLRELPFLEGLTLITSVYNYETIPIEVLTELKSLDLSWCGKVRLDFSKLPCLEYMEIQWHPKNKNLSTCRKLKSLALKYCKQETLDAVAELRQLESLEIAIGYLTDLTPLQNLTNLRSLSLHYLSKLENLRPLEALKQLEVFVMQHCPRATDISPLRNLVGLKRVDFSDNKTIKSLKPLASCTKLEVVTFYGDTRIVDSDLSALNELPKLWDVVFADRKSYTHTRDSFRQKLGISPEQYKAILRHKGDGYLGLAFENPKIVPLDMVRIEVISGGGGV